MATSAYRSYFRTRLTGLGFVEHQDAFAFDNIPGNILDNAFHMEGASLGFLSKSNGLEQDISIVIRVFKKAFRDTTTVMDEAHDDYDTIKADVLKLSNQASLQSNGIIRLLPGTLTFDPLADQNDNGIIINMSFDATVNTDIDC